MWKIGAGAVPLPRLAWPSRCSRCWAVGRGLLDAPRTSTGRPVSGPYKYQIRRRGGCPHPPASLPPPRGKVPSEARRMRVGSGMAEAPRRAGLGPAPTKKGNGFRIRRRGGPMWPPAIFPPGGGKHWGGRGFPLETIHPTTFPKNKNAGRLLLRGRPALFDGCGYFSRPEKNRMNTMAHTAMR